MLANTGSPINHLIALPLPQQSETLSHDFGERSQFKGCSFGEPERGGPRPDGPPTWNRVSVSIAVVQCGWRARQRDEAALGAGPGRVVMDHEEVIGEAKAVAHVT